MLQMMDRGRTPTHWAARNSRLPVTATNRGSSEEPIQIALINNMPDPALEDTEAQFFELLDSAASGVRVRLKLYSLPQICRGELGTRHLEQFYCELDDLFSRTFDGVIVTGTEPHYPDLREEAYWPTLVDLFAWAEQHTASIILSCLSTHAAVLQKDGICRQRLADKQFGVFDERIESAHMLTSGVSEPLRFPHSRWNEVREDALMAAGYTILTKSPEAGVNLFVKKRTKSLFVHFQGHPEYGSGTLAKEYRRDIKRFLRKERQTYPTMPHGYFDPTTTKALVDFQEHVLSSPHEDVHEGFMGKFPECVMTSNEQSPWHLVSIRVYRNWLQYLVSNRIVRRAHVAATPSRAANKQTRWIGRRESTGQSHIRG